jgi:transcription-repair coupling factor (superfamily II helicase)
MVFPSPPPPPLFRVLFLTSTVTQSVHYFNMVRDRMPNTTVEYFRGVYSSSPQVKATYQGLKDGKVEMVISTMALFGKYTTNASSRESWQHMFKNLGLVVVLDESNFKKVSPLELLLQLPAYCDVDHLIMTSLPCPAPVLQSLTGIVEYCIIDTPTVHKVNTLLSVINASIVEQSIRKEMRRKGQSIVVVPREEMVYEVAARIKQLINNVKVAVVDPSRKTNVIADIRILDFIEGGSDVLVSSLAPDSTLVMKNANTIIVVGMSSHIQYY